jgi:hypothetical protein
VFVLQALIAVGSISIIILGWLLAAILGAVKEVAKDLKEHLKNDASFQKELAAHQATQDAEILHLKEGIKHIVDLNKWEEGYLH